MIQWIRIIDRLPETPLSSDDPNFLKSYLFSNIYMPRFILAEWMTNIKKEICLGYIISLDAHDYAKVNFKNFTHWCEITHPANPLKCIICHKNNVAIDMDYDVCRQCIEQMSIQKPLKNELPIIIEEIDISKT
jgi:hypothetical protein